MTGPMQALLFDGSLQVSEVPTPEPGAGEALVRVVMAGICNTDVEIARGYMGFRGVLGHELLGVVEASDDASLVGQRVTAEINLACGACPACARDLGRHCPNRTVLGILGKDGCLAEHVTVPTRNLHPVPASLPDEAAVFTEPLAAAFEIPELVHVGPADRVAVLGDGKLGLLSAMVLRDTGCDLTVVGKHDAKLGRLRRLGIRCALRESFTETGFDVVVEATGSPTGLADAVARTGPRGTLVLKSTFHGGVEMDTARIVIDEIRIVGSRCGPFPAALRALAGKRIDPAPLLDATYPLGKALEAFERAQAPGVLKVAIDLR